MNGNSRNLYKIHGVNRTLPSIVVSCPERMGSPVLIVKSMQIFHLLQVKDEEGCSMWCQFLVGHWKEMFCCENQFA